MTELNIWVAWPSVRMEESRALVEEWKAMGYQTAVLVNPPHVDTDIPNADRVIIQSQWKGFPIAANILCKETPGNIIIVVGDDIYPDKQKTAEELGQEFLQRFPDLFGVMQPTGDDYAAIKECCVSPWIGRRFIEECYENNGPYWEEYFHYWCDRELQEIAMLFEAFQQRSDVSQYHDHWQRREGVKRPPYLMEALHKHTKDSRLFRERQSKKFPG